MTSNDTYMQNAIDYVEDHLDDPALSLETVASIVGYSPSHFSKLFHFLVGQKFQNYVAERRLARCADKLLTTDQRIIDIATLGGFSSQSTFTRAFRTVFGMTPAAYRRNGIHLVVEKPDLSRRLSTIKAVSQPPRFEHIEPFTVVGMRFLWSMATGYNASEWWDAFLPRIASIEGADTSWLFGVCESPSPANVRYESYYQYLAAVRVDHVPASLPRGMVSKQVRGGDYAVFTDDEGLEGLIDTCRYIWGTWVPTSGIVPLDDDNFDVYPPASFSEGGAGIPVEVWYPIEGDHQAR